MATLVLQAVGTAVGSLFGPVGAAIGSAIGGIAGATLDRTLLAKTTKTQGPRLDTLQVMASTEGAAIPRLYGAMRLGGEVIWATALTETVSTRRVGSKGARQSVTDYAYSANFAVGLCEGPVAFVRRVWADGKALDLKGVVMRLNKGGEDQTPDPLIVAKEGADNAPAYRGLAYVVFEELPLADYGNRIPQLTFEVVKPVGGLEAMVTAVNLIPGAGEFVYDDRIISQTREFAATGAITRHMPGAGSDFTAAIDELQALCPALERVALVVAWFGDDLRAGHCTIRPKAEAATRTTWPATWSVAGLSRAGAALVSTIDGRPAYGGTPSDESVMRAIAALKARGLAVTLYPFVMMDIPAGNTLPNPYADEAGQPAYPWRGRITLDVAPGRPGSADLSAAAAADIAAFFGAATPGHFSWGSGRPVYSGPADWRFRRHILHYAALAEAAGGVDAFVVGSEMLGLTRLRSAPGVYPAAGALAALAADARTMLRAGTAIVYAADWTEYGAHVPQAGEVRFPLDPLWASPAIDAVAIDWYPPLSDWRDGADHLDAAGARGIHDRAYLDANIAGGEAFDWCYASDADRAAQLRTPITDGAYAKPWTFRQKDLAGWWGAAHVERVGGAELGAPTAWVPAGKPVWLLEAGYPAVDKGSNQPSSFPDPKSSEDSLPFFSEGTPDDLIQARALEALLGHWRAPAANPVSPVYGGPMLDTSRLYLWAWDARPFPAFPDALDVWSDGANWSLGHWLTGRLGTPTLDRLVAALLADYGAAAVDASRLDGVVPGAVIDRPMSARDALEPLAQLFAFDAIDRAGTLVFRHAGEGTATPLATDDLVLDGEAPALTRVRAQESELPRAVTVSFVDPRADYAAAVETSRRLETASRHETSLDAPLALPREEAARRADILLQDAWIARETAAFALPRSRLALEPGDLVSLDVEGRARLHRLTALDDAGRRAAEARRIEPAVLQRLSAARAGGSFVPVAAEARPFALLLDLPALREGDATLQWLAATAEPWPGALNLWRSTDGASFPLAASLPRPAAIGLLAEPLAPGFAARWDRGAAILVDLVGTGDLAGRLESEVLDGANAAALRRPDGRWEVIQFAEASPVAARRLRLTTLLRGQLGTEGDAGTLPAGTPLVLLDEALFATATRFEEIGRPVLWRVGPRTADAGDEAVIELSGAPTTAALRPYAPVHLKARREAGGVLLTWVRRTRIGGDGWEGEVPLGEAAEAYEVDILDGGTVRRTLAAAGPQALYAASDEIADFGAEQAALPVRVVQISAAVGRGIPAAATLAIETA